MSATIGEWLWRQIHYIGIFDNRIDLVTGAGTFGHVAVPQHLLAVRELRGIAVALVIKVGVERSKIPLGFSHIGGAGPGTV